MRAVRCLEFLLLSRVALDAEQVPRAIAGWVGQAAVCVSLEPLCGLAAWEGRKEFRSWKQLDDCMDEATERGLTMLR